MVTLVKTTSLTPCPIITFLYGEFSLTNPEDFFLFDSIRVNGITHPLVVTRKNEIISGYRRHYVAGMLGIDMVPVTIEDIEDIDELKIIEYNLQRVKNVVTLTYEYKLLLKTLGAKQGVKLKPEIKVKYDNAKKIIEKLVSKTTRYRITDAVGAVQRLNPEIGEREAYKIVAGEVEKGLGVKTVLKNFENQEKNQQNRERIDDFKDLEFDDFRVIHGDARTAHNLIKDSSIQSLICSPPYYNMRIYSESELDASDYPLGEEPNAEMYVQRQADVFINYKSKIKKDGSVFINVMDKIHKGRVCRIPDKLITEMENRGFKFIQDIIWFKSNPPFSGNRKMTQPSREYILHFICEDDDDYYWDSDFLNDTNFSLMNDALYGGEDKKKLFRNVIIPSKGTSEDIEEYYGGLISTGVFNPKKLKEVMKSKGFNLNHNALFDFEIPLLLILISSKVDDEILDNYSGLATTGLAAFSVDRKYVGIEFSEEYVAQSKARFEAIFGGVGENDRQN
jgi:DNA modification methylase